MQRGVVAFEVTNQALQGRRFALRIDDEIWRLRTEPRLGADPGRVLEDCRLLFGS